jgi:hypothetical protein
VNAADVKAALRRRHAGEAWSVIEEAFCGFASAGGGIDVLAVGAWQTASVPGLPLCGKATSKWDSASGQWIVRGARYPVVAYEVKVTRSDYRREVNGYRPGPNAAWGTRHVPPWPGKAYWALARSHYFVFATPPGLLKPEEYRRREWPDDGGLWLPAEAGLVEVLPSGVRVVVRSPPPRPARPFTPGEVGELIRHALRPVERLRRERDELARLVRAAEERAAA